MSVDFNTKTMKIYILLYFSIGIRLSFYPGMGDVTVRSGHPFGCHQPKLINCSSRSSIRMPLAQAN
jgi:hypothetical protein